MGAGKVNPVPRRPVLGRDGNSPFLQPLQYVQLKWVERSIAQRRSQLAATRCGELQILSQELRAPGARSPWFYVMVGERGNNTHPGTCTRDGDVEPPLAALLVEWPEPVGQRPLGVLVVTDAEDDGIPLIALHALDILDEEPLLGVLGEELVQRLVVDLAEAFAQRLVDVVWRDGFRKR